MESKNIVVAGGAGFIGSNLCRALLQFGNNVYVIDNFYTGRRINLDSITNSGIHINECDITDAAGLKLIAENIGSIDEIYNLACPASPPAYQSQPIHTIETCIIVNFQ